MSANQTEPGSDNSAKIHKSDYVVLFVGLEPNIHARLTEYFPFQTWPLIFSDTIEDARKNFLTKAADIIVWSIPADITDVAQSLSRYREGVPTPLIVWTANKKPEFHTLCLNAGADDVVLPSIDMREFAARVRAITRRYPDPIERVEAITDRWFLNYEVGDLMGADGKTVRLTKAQFDFIGELIRRRGMVVTADHFEMNLTAFSRVVRNLRAVFDAEDQGSGECIVQTIRHPSGVSIPEYPQLMRQLAKKPRGVGNG